MDLEAALVGVVGMSGDVLLVQRVVVIHVDVALLVVDADGRSHGADLVLGIVVYHLQVPAL